MSRLRVLHLEDDDCDAFFIHRALAESGIAVEIIRATSEADFISAIENGKLDLVLLDNGLPGFSGSVALKMTREKCPHTPVIVVSGAAEERQVAATLKAGASDFVLKHKLPNLVAAVRRLHASAKTPSQ